MLESTVTVALAMVGTYLALGVAIAGPFAVWGVGRIDAHAREGTWGFRVLILPGVALLWPWLLRRWVLGREPREERNAHRDLARASGAEHER